MRLTILQPTGRQDEVCPNRFRREVVGVWH